MANINTIGGREANNPGEPEKPGVEPENGRCEIFSILFNVALAYLIEGDRNIFGIFILQ